GMSRSPGGGRRERAKPKRKAIKQSADKTYAVWHQIDRIDEDRGKCARHDQADEDAEHAGPEQVHMRQQERKWQGSEDRDPDDAMATDAVANYASDDDA